MRKLISLMLCGIMLCGCLPFAGCGEKKNPNNLPTLDGKKLITFGDSLTAFGTWPLTVAENTNMYLFNAATGGINSKEALERFDRYVAERDPDFVTLSFGMNDLLMQVRNVPQVKPDKFKENMQTLCEKIIELDAIPILLTVSYLNEDVFFTSQGQPEAYYEVVGSPLEWLDVYNEKIRELAKENNYHMVDIRKACDEYKVTEFLVADGIHLGETGNQVYADLITDYLKEHFYSDPDAAPIGNRFPSVSSPEEPATMDIISYDPADWDCAEEGTLNFEAGKNGELVLSNNNGQWPDAQYTADQSVYVPFDDTELVYDFSTANVKTSIILFFGGATPFATTDGKWVSINDKLGVRLEAGSGDIMANQTCKGSIKLSDLGIPKTAIDDKGNILFSGVKVFVAGGAKQKVTIRQLAVSTQGAPNE